MLTSKMSMVEKKLTPELAKKVRLVSVTLDPEHDNPAQLLKYANEHGANGADWIFLTGTPAQVDAYLAVFLIKRTREPDGSIDHVTTSFLLGPDGRQIRQYDGISGDAINIGRRHQSRARQWLKWLDATELALSVALTLSGLMMYPAAALAHCFPDQTTPSAGSALALLATASHRALR